VTKEKEVEVEEPEDTKDEVWMDHMAATLRHGLFHGLPVRAQQAMREQ
jgi:hypothetical protein